MTDAIPLAEDSDVEPSLALGRTARTIRESAPEHPDWLVPGMVARGMTTEVNGREKAGKGYFEFYLIAALEHHSPTVLGPSSLSDPTLTLIYTEEPEQSLKEKLDLFDINDAHVIYHWELASLSWPEVVETLADHAVAHGLGMLFVDNISAATGTQDENGVELARHVEPLTGKAKKLNMAVLYDRHQRKTEGGVRDRARGGTALAGAVDVIVAMEQGHESERTLVSWGRLWETNWTRRVVLADTHDDYTQLEGADWKEGRLLKRAEWTIKEFADAIKQGTTTAETYLKNHPRVEQRGKRGKENLYRVILAPEAPALD